MWGIFWQAKDLLATEEGLCSKELLLTSRVHNSLLHHVFVAMRNSFFLSFFLSFSVQRPLPTYHCRCKGYSYIWSHTRTSHSRLDASGRVISPSQRPLPDNTILTTDKHPCPRRDYAQLILKNVNSQLWFHEANGYIWSQKVRPIFVIVFVVSFNYKYRFIKIWLRYFLWKAESSISQKM